MRNILYILLLFSLSSQGQLMKSLDGKIFGNKLIPMPVGYVRTMPEPVTWYDFTDLATITKSNDSISIITNKGTAGGSATAAGALRPVYTASLINSHGGATFNGSNTLTTSETNYGSDYTIFIACKIPNVESPGQVVLGSTKLKSVRLRKNSVKICMTDSIYGYAYRPDDKNSYTDYFSFRKNGLIFNYQERKNYNSWYFYNDLYLSSQLVLKDIGGYAGNRLSSEVYEILIYNVALSDTENDSINDYLESKYALTSMEESTDNGIMILGNSFTEARVWSDRLIAHLRTTADWTQLVYGKSGVGTTQLFQNCNPNPSYIQYFWCRWIDLYPKSKNQIAILWEGVNDIGAYNLTALQTEALLQTAYTNLKAKGYYTCAVTILPALDSVAYPNMRPRRDSINTWMRANWASWADTLIDVAANTTMGENGDQYNTTYYSADKIHPTTTGYQYICDQVFIPIIDAIKEE